MKIQKRLVVYTNDDNERLNGDSDIIVKNGELIKGVDNNV